MHSPKPVFFLLLLGIFLYTACDLTEPSYIDRPPIVKKYSPENSNITTFLGDTLRFSISVTDPDGGRLHQYFLLGDSIVSNGATWEYVVQDTGLITVKSVTKAGGRTAVVRWEVERLKPLNLRPVIKYYEPPDLDPVVIIGNQLDFTILAEDPEGQPLAYWYQIGDSIVSTSRHYSFIATSFNDVEIAAIVKDEERFNGVVWSVHVSEVPDSIPPARVEVLSLMKGLEPGELIVRWVAVGEDSMEGLPSYYQVRTLSVPILTDFDWSHATDRPGEPPPAPPGEVQEMVIRELLPADSVHVSVRAVDKFSNKSPLSNSPGAWTKGMEVFGSVRNAVTNEPLEGIIVKIAGREALTAVDGWFELTELPFSSGEIRIVDETAPVDFGTYFDFIEPYRVSHNDTLHRWLIPNIQLDTEWYPNLLNFFKHMTNTYSNNFGNILRTWEIPVAIYVKPFEKDGLDYAATIIEILEEYEMITNRNLFEIVSSPPDVGLRVDYKSNLYADNYSVEEWSSGLMLPVRGVIKHRMVYSPTTVNVFRKIIRHEVGHALGMSHSKDENHLMFGAIYEIPWVQMLSQDELNVLFAMYQLPRGYFMNWYIFD